MVSASGTDTANRPAELKTLNPSARLAPEPSQSSGTHDSGSPASVKACHSGLIQLPSLLLLMVWASARSLKMRSAVSATIFSLSATAFPVCTSAHLMRRKCRAWGAANFLGRHDGEKPPG